jgi:hypothetical protein
MTQPNFREMLSSIGRDAHQTGVRKWVHTPITLEERVGSAPIYAPEMCEYDMRITFGRKAFCKPEDITRMAKLMRREVAHYCFDSIRQQVNLLEMMVLDGADRQDIRHQFHLLRKEMDIG